MDYTIAMSAWAVTIAAPCIASWIAGEKSGVARTRRAVAQAAAFETNAPAADIWWFAAKRNSPDNSESVPARKAATAQPTVRPAPSDTDSLSIEEKVRQAEERHRQRRALMPGRGPVDRQTDSRASDEGDHTAEFRDRLAPAALSAMDDQAIEGVLRHYDWSIRAMEEIRLAQRAEDRLALEAGDYAHDLPVIVTEVPGWQEASGRVR